MPAQPATTRRVRAGPTEPCTGCGRFLLSSGCEWGRYYWAARSAGLTPNETQIPCRTPIGENGSKTAYFSHSAGTVHAQRTVRPPTEPCTGCGRFLLSSGCEWGKYYWAARSAGLTPNETQIPCRTPIEENGSKPVYFSHSAGTVHAQRTVRPPTEPCTGCGRFLLSSGCEWGKYYRAARSAGLTPNETQIPCRTPIGENGSKTAYFSHSAGTVHAQRTVRPPTEPCTGCGRFLLSSGCEWGKYYWAARSAGLTPNETQIPCRTPIEENGSKPVYFSHSAGTVHTQRTVRPPTEPCTGCGRFLLSSGCEWGKYYRAARSAGLTPNETQIPCRTPIGENGSKTAYFSHSAGTVHAQRTVRPPTEPCTGCGRFLLSSGCEWGKYYWAARSAELTPNETQIPCRTPIGENGSKPAYFSHSAGTVHTQRTVRPPTEPCTGCGRFLLSSGCEWGKYYRVARSAGLTPNETQIPCRTPIGENGSKTVYFSHSAGTVHAQRTVRPPTEPCTGCGRFLLSSGCEWGKYYRAARSAGLTPNETQIPCRTGTVRNKGHEAWQIRQMAPCKSQ